MDWTIPALFSNMITTIILTLVFFYLYLNYDEKHLRVWSLAWFVYVLRFIFQFTYINTGFLDVFSIYTQICVIISAYLLLSGTYLWAGKKLSSFWKISAATIIIWTFISSILKLDFITTNLPVFLYSGIANIYTGVQFLKFYEIGKIGKTITGILFILWGLHKFDYPFLRPVESFAVWGYFIGALLTFSISIGIILTYFEKLQLELKGESDYLSTILNSLSVGLALIGNNGKFIDCNDLWVKMSGYRKEELKLKTFHDITHPDDKTSSDIFFSDNKNIGESYILEKRYIKKNGVEFWVRLNVIKQQNISISIIEDITSQKEGEFERKRLSNIIQSASIALIGKDKDGIINAWNKGSEKIFGYTSGEVIGKHISILIPEKEYPEFEKAMKKVIEGNSVNDFKTERVNKNGETIYVIVNMSPIKNENDEIVGVSSIAQNITAEEQLKSQLRHTQKMEAIGTLAGGISHDFNNILAAILGYTDLLLMTTDKSSPDYENLTEIRSASLRATELVKQILTFSRKTEERTKPIKIQYIISEAMKMMEKITPTNIEVTSYIDKNVGYVNANPTQIYQIITNLCTNANHAMSSSNGLLTITFRSDYFDVSFYTANQTLPSGEYAVLIVKDTGKGMEPEVIERIFEPYFTTKRKGEGTGLGLSTVHGVVASLGGAIQVESQLDLGTEFRIYLPIVSSENINEIKEIPINDTKIKGEGTVLFVDDEKSILKIGESSLTDFGFNVITAINGEEAWDIFQKYSESIDYIVADNVMPKLSGLDLSEKVKNFNPNVPIVICTGSKNEFNEKRAREIGVEEYLIKPIIFKDLAKILIEMKQ